MSGAVLSTMDVTITEMYTGSAFIQCLVQPIGIGTVAEKKDKHRVPGECVTESTHWVWGSGT